MPDAIAQDVMRIMSVLVNHPALDAADALKLAEGVMGELRDEGYVLHKITEPCPAVDA